MGKMHENGYPYADSENGLSAASIIQPDSECARSWYQRSAANGSPQGASALAGMKT